MGYAYPTPERKEEIARFQATKGTTRAMLAKNELYILAKNILPVNRSFLCSSPIYAYMD